MAVYRSRWHRRMSRRAHLRDIVISLSLGAVLAVPAWLITVIFLTTWSAM